MKIAIGTMNFGKRTPAAESERIVRFALESGLTTFDTANVYNDGESESILGRALGAKRGACTIASKVGLGRIDRHAEGLSKGAIRGAIDASLRRLGTDYVDVYYLHAPDPRTPIEETLDAIAELLAEKRVRAWGVSNYASWQILEMMHLADARGMARPSISQVIYNLLIREIEIEYLAFARKHALHTTIYNPLAGGFLAGKYERAQAIAKGSRFDANAMYQRRYWSPKMFDMLELLLPIAKEEGLTMVELSYAWAASRERDGVDSILVGPVTSSHLEAAIAACGKTLTEPARAKIDAAHREWTGTDTHYAR